MKEQTMNPANLVEKFQSKFDQQWQTFNDDHELWRQIFTVYPSEQATEKDLERTLLNVSDSSSKTKNVTEYEHKTHELGFTVSQEEAEEGWTRSLENQCHTLFKAFTDEIEKAAAGVFDEVLTSPKFSCHRGKSELSHTSFEEALISLQNSKDASGLYTRVNPRILLVPSALQFKMKLFEPLLEKDSFLKLSILEKVLVNPYLSNPHAWFVLTDALHGFKCFERKAPAVSVFEDKYDSVIRFQIKARYSFGCTNPNAVFASTGTGESK